MAVTHQHGLMVGARSFPGNPYDGHTLAAQIEQTTTLLQDIGVKPTTAIVDLGYRGVDKDLTPVEVIHRGKSKPLSPKQRNWLKRRQAIEPLIGHTKADHRIDRCWLKGAEADALHAVLCAAGFNIQGLLRVIARLGLPGLFAGPIRAGPVWRQLRPDSRSPGVRTDALITGCSCRPQRNARSSRNKFRRPDHLHVRPPLSASKLKVGQSTNYWLRTVALCGAKLVSMRATLTMTAHCFRRYLAGAVLAAEHARQQALALIKPGTIHFLRNSRDFRAVMLLAAVVAVSFAVDSQLVGGLEILVPAWLLISSLAALLFWQPCFKVTFTPAVTLACPPVAPLPMVSIVPPPQQRPPAH